MREHVTVALGCDACNYNNNLDKIETMRCVALLQKVNTLVFTSISAMEVLKMAYNKLERRSIGKRRTYHGGMKRGIWEVFMNPLRLRDGVIIKLASFRLILRYSPQSWIHSSSFKAVLKPSIRQLNADSEAQDFEGKPP